MQIKFFLSDGRYDGSVAKIHDWIAMKSFFLDGGHLEIWSGNNRPFDEYPQSCRAAKRLIAAVRKLEKREQPTTGGEK